MLYCTVSVKDVAVVLFQDEAEGTQHRLSGYVGKELFTESAKGHVREGATNTPPSLYGRLLPPHAHTEVIIIHLGKNDLEIVK